MADQQRLALEIFRYDPEADANAAPRYDRYEVPYREHWVVLDAINWIKDEVDGTLAHRWSCRMGVCGSCGMMVNGEPRLSCNVFLRDYVPGPVRIEPLQHFAVEKDLVVDLEGFMRKLEQVKPYLMRDDVERPEQGPYNQTPAQMAQYHEHSMCINCMLCYAACPVVNLEPAFPGPAALALAQRYNLDSRDRGKEHRLEAVGGEHELWGCTFVGECTDVCPKNVDPAGAIQKMKLEATKRWYLHLVQPKGAGR